MGVTYLRIKIYLQIENHINNTKKRIEKIKNYSNTLNFFCNELPIRFDYPNVRALFS